MADNYCPNLIAATVPACEQKSFPDGDMSACHVGSVSHVALPTRPADILPSGNDFCSHAGTVAAIRFGQ